MLKLRKIKKPLYTFSFSLRSFPRSAYWPRHSWVRFEQTYALSYCNLRNHNLKMMQKILCPSEVGANRQFFFFTILLFNLR